MASSSSLDSTDEISDICLAHVEVNECMNEEGRRKGRKEGKEARRQADSQPAMDGWMDDLSSVPVSWSARG